MGTILKLKKKLMRPVRIFCTVSSISLLSCSPIKPENKKLELKAVSPEKTNPVENQSAFLMEFPTANNEFFLWKPELSEEFIGKLARVSEDYDDTSMRLEEFEKSKIVPLEEELKKIRGPIYKELSQARKNLEELQKQIDQQDFDYQNISSFTESSRTIQMEEQLVLLRNSLDEYAIEKEKLLANISELEFKYKSEGKNLQELIRGFTQEKSRIEKESRKSGNLVYSNADFFTKFPTIIIKKDPVVSFTSSSDNQNIEIYVYGWNLNPEKDEPKDYSTAHEDIFSVDYNEKSGRLKFTVNLGDGDRAYFDLTRTLYHCKKLNSQKVVFRGNMKIVFALGEYRYGKAKLVGKIEGFPEEAL